MRTITSLLLALLLLALLLAAQQLRFDVPHNIADGSLYVDRGLQVSVGGTGPYTATLSSTSCMELTKYVGASTSTNPVSGTAPEVLVTRPKRTCGDAAGPAAGTTLTPTLTIVGAGATVNGSSCAVSCVVNITTVIHAMTPHPQMAAANKTANFGASLCTEKWRENWQNCPYTVRKPGGSSGSGTTEWTPPAAGGVNSAGYTDPITGQVIKRVITGDITRYANQHAINYDETMMSTMNGIVNLSDGSYALAYSPVRGPGNTSASGGDRDKDLRFFPEPGSPPRLFGAIQSSTSTISTYSLSGGSLTNLNNHNCGIGDLNAWFNAPSKTGWVAFSNAANTHICLINLFTGQIKTGAAAYPNCCSPTEKRDNLYISRGRDRVTGSHYLVYAGSEGMQFYSFSESQPLTLLNTVYPQKAYVGDTTYEGTGFWDLTPSNSAWLLGDDHTDTAEIDGEQVVFTQNGWAIYFNRINQANGTLDELRLASYGVKLPTAGFFLGHVGCADFVPFCAGSVRTNTFKSASTISNAVTNGSDIELTLNAPVSGLVDGDTAQVNGVAGCTAANGNSVVGGISGNTVKLIGKNCNGSYVASVTDFITKASSSRPYDRVVAWRLGEAKQSYVVGDHRSELFANTDDYFSGQPWAFLSPRGKYVCYKANLGSVDQWNIMCAEVNLGAKGDGWLNANSQVQVTPGSGTLAFGWNSNGLTSCTLSVSAQKNISSASTPSITNSNGRMTATATSLTPGQQYWALIDCDASGRALVTATPK